MRVPGIGTETFDVTRTETQDVAKIQGAGLVLSPLGMQAVLRALNSGNLAEQKSNPTLITEDNEEATISIIDRVPIITATVNQTTAGLTVTEEVRYRIDEADPSNDPANTREVGVTVAVKPTLLPDNTVRMELRPRTAQIVEFIEGIPAPGFNRGNRYPRVAEATIETIARVPNGYSLLIGGFYNEEKVDGETKVPFFGDIPFLNFFFKSRETQQEQTSLVFIITPTAYNPEGALESLNVTDQLMDRLDIKAGHDSINPHAPGPAHKADLRRTMRGILFDATGLPPEQLPAELPQLNDPLPPSPKPLRANPLAPPAAGPARPPPPPPAAAQPAAAAKPRRAPPQIFR
jgi:type II secretory pathway component GspD/PulD (secretin)